MIHDGGTGTMITGRIGIWAALACLLAAACGGPEAGTPESLDSDEAGPRAAVNQMAAEPRASIMRPSVVEEAPPPAPPPPAEPFRATILFDAGSALSDEAKAELDKAAAMLAGTDGPIILRGHTDSKGNDADNKLMSHERAERVRDYLAEKGIAEERMTLVALGEARPAAPNARLDGSDDEEGRRRNRRVEIVAAPAAPASVSDKAAGDSPSGSE